MTVKAVSFNIRYKSDADGHSVSERAPRIEAVTGDFGADIIGFQEYTPAWEGEIRSRYGDVYEMLVKYRDDSEDIEASPILWRKDRFQLLETEHFWLSDTPEVKSRGWDTDCTCYRMCVAAVLRERQTGAEFAVMNTHFGLSHACHGKSAELILSRAAKYADLPLILLGDFNTEPSEAAYIRLAEAFTDVNAVTVNDTGETYHGYGRERERIDYIFVNGHVTPVSFFVDRRKFGEKYASDHYALCAELEIH